MAGPELLGFGVELVDPASAIANLAIGASTITGGTSGRILYDNGGKVGEKTVTGTGDVVLATSPTLITPTIGVAIGTSLALGGATLGSNALAVTGLANISGVVTVASGTATPAGGSTSARLLFGTTAGFGIYYGSGAPTGLTAAQGSLYLRSDGTTINDRAYINSDGSTTWTALTTAG